MPIIAWFDQRTRPQARWWRESVGVARTQRICGILPRAVFGAPKMLWTKAHAPEAWAAGRHWLNMADWAAYRITGEMATDHSLASRTMLFDLSRRRWSDELLDAADLDGGLLAPLIESGQRVGSVTSEASARTGLPVGTPVAAGGQDHVCAPLALGVTEPGMVLDSIGTAEAFLLVTEAVDPAVDFGEAGIDQGAHVEAECTYALTGLVQGGGRIDAVRRELGLDWDEFLVTSEARDVIEAVATAGQEQLTVLLEMTGTKHARHVVTGGGSRNIRLIERKRAIGGRPIDIARHLEATALGAARLARRAISWDGG